MKYVISESKLHNAIVKFFEKQIPPEKLKYFNYSTTDKDGNEYESNDAFGFYNIEENNENVVFRYYTCEYFDEGVDIKCPVVSLENYYEYMFDDMFGDLWRPIFLEWMNERFELNAKVVH